MATKTTPAADLHPGQWVRMYDDEMGTHLREVAEVCRLERTDPLGGSHLAWPSAREVLVGWVGDDLVSTVWPADWPVEVVA